MTTEDPIAEAKRLLAERTPGGWEVVFHNPLGDESWYEVIVPGVSVASIALSEDAALIAAAPRLLQALIDRLEKAERGLRDNSCEAYGARMTAATARTLMVTVSGPDPSLSPNARVHWAKLRKAAARKEAWAKALESRHPGQTFLPEQWGYSQPAEAAGSAVTIRRTFYRPTRRQADIDNLEAATKSMADGIADALGVNDRIFVWLPSVVIVERGRREVVFEIEVE